MAFVVAVVAVVVIVVSLEAEAVLGQQAPQLPVPNTGPLWAKSQMRLWLWQQTQLSIAQDWQLEGDTSKKGTPGIRSQLSGNGFLLGVA